jgi:ElaB/YqjD/DUF883 family membrane-anchored ribosome-binding protein
MSGSSRYSRAIAAEVGEIERRLRSLEKNLEKIGVSTSANAKNTAASLVDAIASGLVGWADRFRQGARSFGDQSAAMGKDAAKLGSSALKGLSHETERHPFFALAVAVGVGVLIGMVSRNWD